MYDKKKLSSETIILYTTILLSFEMQEEKAVRNLKKLFSPFILYFQELVTEKTYMKQLVLLSPSIKRSTQFDHLTPLFIYFFLMYFTFLLFLSPEFHAHFSSLI